MAPGRKYSRSKGKRQKDQINPPAGGAFLDMPQIKQKILIPPHNKEFHFGRNNVLGLIGPSQEYDLEWLNSISRVQKGKNNKFVRQHFFITKENNQFYIEDKQSSWGTWVNGRQIKGLGKIPLKNGDKIELKLGKPGVDQIIPFVLHFSC